MRSWRRGLAVVVLAICLGVVGPVVAQAQAGGNCFGVTRAAGSVVAVQGARPGYVVTVATGGLQDRVRTLKRYAVGDAVRVTGIVCWGQLDVVRFGR